MSNNHKLPRVHRQTLVEMNVPVFTARCAAAHDRVLELLRQELPRADRDGRRRLYAECERLLGDAIQCTQRSQIQHDSPILRYLQILQETIHLSLAHQEHAEHLAREAKEIARLTGTAVPAAVAAGNALSNSELQMLAFIEDLLQFGEPLLTADLKQRRSAFNDDDRRRFGLARAEYDRFYWRGDEPPQATECAP